MKFNQIPTCLLAATLVAPVFASGTSARRLRGNSDNVVNRNRQGNSNSNSKKECTIQAVDLLEIPGASMGDDLVVECTDDNNLSQVVTGTPKQMKNIKAMIARGSIVPGRSRMGLGPKNNPNKPIFLGDDFDPKAGIRKKTHPLFDRDLEERRRLDLFGDKPILVVKVYDTNGLARPEDEAQIGDDIFGTNGDPVNLKSQLYDCSHSKLNVVAGAIANPENEAAPGVMNVTIPIDIATAATRGEVRNAVTTAVQAKLGFTLPGPYEQVMYVLEKCYNDCGWAAYAYINSWNSVYQNSYYKQVGVLVHELGHNFGLAHSGGLDGATYTDHTGMMGNPLYSDDVGKMCYNAAKNWQIGWYDDRKQALSPLDQGSDWSQTVTMVGIADYSDNSSNHPVVLKLETGTSNDFFIGFNRATGINSQNDEADNEVTIITTGNNGEGYSQSYLQAHLVEGESYTITSFAGSAKNIVIEAVKIDIATSPGTAEILVRTDQAPTASPTPNTVCNSEPGTKRVQVNVLIDNYPGETSWTLFNECTQANEKTYAADVTTSYSTANTGYSDQWCVPEGRYTFTLTDSYGDGLCCSYGTGGYDVVYGSDEVASGGAFGSSESTTFGTCGPTPTPPPVTSSPTDLPSPSPSVSPTKAPSKSPSSSPSVSPTKAPSKSPSLSPTKGPTISPTLSPSQNPSKSPTPSPVTSSPTLSPSASPSTSPTQSPTVSPTSSPSQSSSLGSPTKGPSASPSKSPSISPTKNPTKGPSVSPTSLSPSKFPSKSPITPTNQPSNSPTKGPSASPSKSPSITLSQVVAQYDPSLGAPKCIEVGSSCTSGDLLDGKATNIELNAPNTLDTCTDGSSGSYHSDESIDKVTVSAVGGGQLQAGGLAEIEAKVWPYSNGSGDTADFYYTGNVNGAPIWTYIGSLPAGGSGLRSLKIQYSLSDSSMQAVRVNFRYFGSQSSCSGGRWDEVDDLVFTVAPSVEGAMETRKPKPVPALEPNQSSHCALIGNKGRCNEASVCKWQNSNGKRDGKGCYPS